MIDNLIRLPPQVLRREESRLDAAERIHQREAMAWIEHARREARELHGVLARELPVAQLNLQHAAVLEVVKTRLSALAELRLGGAKL